MASLINKLTPENTLAAREFLEKSLALDPYSANAWSQLAYVLTTDYMRTWNRAGEEVLKQAEKAVQKAYEISRSVALAHVAEGKIREVRGNLPGELEALNAALELDPNLPDRLRAQSQYTDLSRGTGEGAGAADKGDGTRPA